MTLEMLKEDYQRRLDTATKLLEENSDNGSVVDRARTERLKTKQSCYRTMLTELDKVTSYQNNELLEACIWAEQQFKRLAEDGRYPEFMLTQNGGDGFMPLVKAIENYKNKK